MHKKLIRFDWAMKTLLRDKANFDVLEGFLCALFEDDNIKILHILESETNSEDENDKFNRVDMLVQDSQNRKIYIEIQNTRETDYLESLLYATSKIIVEHQDLGENFKDISKVISISILYFNLGTGDDYIYYGTNEFKGLNTGHQLIVKKRIEISAMLEPKYKFVEKKIFPEYYLITVERYKNIVQKRIDEWIYMIKNNEIAEGSKSKNIDKAKQKKVTRYIWIFTVIIILPSSFTFWRSIQESIFRSNAENFIIQNFEFEDEMNQNDKQNPRKRHGKRGNNIAQK